MLSKHIRHISTQSIEMRGDVKAKDKAAKQKRSDSQLVCVSAMALHSTHLHMFLTHECVASERTVISMKSKYKDS
jgi:hypothetical protein